MCAYSYWLCSAGDLKTYLLSRRNLVGQNIKEAEDMNSENLTQMAIDIASGLQYLHHLKYVHRSVRESMRSVTALLSWFH